MSEPECTCTELERMTVCHDMRNEPHVVGCPRWGTRKAVAVNMPDPTTAPPWHQRAYAPDTGQVASWLSSTSEVNRRWWVERTQQQVETAHDCLIRGHEQQIDTLRDQLKKERERVAWLERNYGDPL